MTDTLSKCIGRFSEYHSALQEAKSRYFVQLSQCVDELATQNVERLDMKIRKEEHVLQEKKTFLIKRHQAIEAEVLRRRQLAMLASEIRHTERQAAVRVEVPESSPLPAAASDVPSGGFTDLSPTPKTHTTHRKDTHPSPDRISGRGGSVVDSLDLTPSPSPRAASPSPPATPPVLTMDGEDDFSLVDTPQGNGGRSPEVTPTPSPTLEQGLAPGELDSPEPSPEMTRAGDGGTMNASVPHHAPAAPPTAATPDPEDKPPARTPETAGTPQVSETPPSGKKRRFGLFGKKKDKTPDSGDRGAGNTPDSAKTKKKVGTTVDDMLPTSPFTPPMHDTTEKARRDHKPAVSMPLFDSDDDEPVLTNSAASHTGLGGHSRLSMGRGSALAVSTGGIMVPGAGTGDTMLPQSRFSFNQPKQQPWQMAATAADDDFEDFSDDEF